MKKIKLTQGKCALIDDADFELVSRYNWFTIKCGDGPKLYAATNIRIHSGRCGQRLLRMHNLIFKPPKGRIVDHADGNGLNNQRSNLRHVTRGQNRANSKQNRKFRGVYEQTRKSKKSKAFYADIRYDGKNHYLGSFHTAEEAARAYDEEALKIYGDCAYLNFGGKNNEQNRYPD